MNKASMFDALEAAPPDAILGLTEAFQQDKNPDKINLTVGVYQDAQGRTPTLECVRQAERYLMEHEANKSYLGIAGLARFDDHVQQLLLGADHPALAAGRAATAQTPGGTGALRVSADFLHRNFGGLRIWCSKPTWANHPGVFQAAGHEVQHYTYLDPSGTGLDYPGLLQSLQQIPEGDVVCLHACCHNPTGVDPTEAQWQEIGELMKRRRLLPLVDFAYLGFGDGLREDATGIHRLLEHLDEMLICSSYSKNFGLYGERVGALTLVTSSAEAAQTALSQIKSAIRTNYSNPPRHGALLVATILDDHKLRAQWQLELAAMRDRIHSMRGRFVQLMKDAAPNRDFSFIAKQRGMFSFSGLNALQVDRLRNEYAIYVVGSGRINVAGMNEHNLPRLCQAIGEVIR